MPQPELKIPTLSRISGALGQIKSSRHYVGWKSENIRQQERYFFLTSPFIELHGTWLQSLRIWKVFGACYEDQSVALCSRWFVSSVLLISRADKCGEDLHLAPSVR